MLMARRFSICLTPLLAAALLGPAAAHASLVAYEGFESYALNATVEGFGSASDPGWQGAWGDIAGSPQDVTIVDAGLSYSGGTVVVDGGDRAVRISDSLDAVLLREFDNVSGGEVWFSFLYQQGTGSDSQDFINFWVSHDGDRNNSGGIGDHSTSNRQFSVRIRSASDKSPGVAGTSPVKGQTYFLVGRFTTEGSTGPAGEFDQLEMWINPTSADLNAGNRDVISDQRSVTNGPISFFGIRSVGITSEDQHFFDELRIGADAASVVPIPEAGSLILIGVGSVVLLRRERTYT